LYIYATLKQTTVLDVRQFIDERPFSTYQLLTAVMCSALVFMDGYDAQAMGFVGPALRAQLHIALVPFGRVVSIGLVGMMIGALGCGPIADRFGRKPVLVGCSFVFGIGSLLTATATSLDIMFIYRFFTGIGLGGAMPNAIALTSEYAPKKYRATAVMTMFTGFSIGAAVGGLVAARLISRWGWQSVFVVGGVLPLIIGLVALVFLPESIRFLLVRGKDRTLVVRYLSRIAPDHGAFDEVVAGGDEHRAGGFAVAELFADRRTSVTLLLWVMFFMNLLDLYFINSWLPTVINDIGIRVETAIIITSMFQVGGAVGALLLGRFFDREGSFKFLAFTYLGAAVTIFLIGEVGVSVPLLTLTVFAAGIGVIGGQTGSNALTAEFYPTAIRSTGVGWALGIGRIGSIIGPTLGGMLLAIGGQTRHVFWAAAMPPLIAMTAAFGAAFIQKGRRK
jgi:AAHS family 4-hydroxybenzoate transporter-like MFS transporter